MKFFTSHKAFLSKLVLFFVLFLNLFFFSKGDVFALTGGPDTYGYIYADSNQGFFSYSWNDISATGTSVGTLGDDSIYGPFNIGFTFSFYGTDYTQFYVCNNGYIVFNNTCAYNNVSITNSGTPNNFIAPFWDDLYTGGSIKYQSTGSSPNGQLVISFLGINHINAQAGAATFQIILSEASNMIMFQYQDVDFGNATYDSGASATVGIENSSGTDGLQFSFNTASLSANYAVGFLAQSSYTQSAYRFFSNTDSTSVGSALAAQDSAPTVTAGATFRLRTLIHVGRSVLNSNNIYFKLQFADKGAGTCSSPTGTYADVDGTTAVAFSGNATPADGDALTASGSDPTHSTDTVANQTYEEGNSFTNSQSSILAGQDGKWDFSLSNLAMTSGHTYCMRIVLSDNTALNTYSVYPEITAGSDYLTYSIGAGVDYNWSDISGTGTSVGALGDESMYGPYNIGFAFNFGGTDYTQFYICNNGYISFSSICSYTNTSIPNAATPNNFFAPFWDDLFTSGSIKYLSSGVSPNKQLVVSWLGINDYGAQANPITFQVILSEASNNITFQYQDVDTGNVSYDSGASATVGIESADGMNGLQISYNTASLSPNYAIQFYQTPGSGYTYRDSSLASNTMSFGTLSSSSVSAISHTITVSTSAAGGYVLYVSEDGNLRNGANDINDVADGAVTAGSEEYGLNTGYNDFTSDSAIASSQKIARSHSSPVTSEVTTCTYKASISGATTGASYSHIVDYVVTGTF
ncbi:MAG: hypothetical protein NTX63_03690 [Candidatus Peregrinibacteria bacterium]|nr:hypothetical protein [Candidatus Peregrinibacteria bacterium]